MALAEPIESHTNPASAKPPRTIEHAGLLEDEASVPAWVAPAGAIIQAHYSCAFCGVGDGGIVTTQRTSSAAATPPAGEGMFRVDVTGGAINYPAQFDGSATLTFTADAPAGSLTSGRFCALEKEWPMLVTRTLVDGRPLYRIATTAVSSARASIGGRSPTAGCVKLNTSMGQQRPLFPIHIEPSLLDRDTGQRTAISYSEAIERLAGLLLAHRPPGGRTLVYACGQVDYFTIFAFQEVFRLLGVTNLAGNAEHCLNAGAVHNEILTGQEGPFLTIDAAVNGENRFFLLNGWNGLITHPPVFHSILKRKDLDAYLVEVAMTESAEMLVRKLGAERLVLIRSGSDPHLALGVAHEILEHHPEAVDRRFVERYADGATFESFTELARSPMYDAEETGRRIAAEPHMAPDVTAAIRAIAARFADPKTVPINLPSVGLSQTKGAVAHALWGSTLALVGKYGLRADGTPAGGTLRIPGQINAETEVQGLSRRIFMGRIKRDEEGSVETARRMRLPDDAYEKALHDTPRAALDYSDDAEEHELFLFFGTQFEANMMERSRWTAKLRNPKTTFVVIDPIPDRFSVEHAHLIIPSPPHSAAAKLYQNGEWRLTLSLPNKRAGAETRTDPTVIYDAMAAISRTLREDPAAAAAHPDLARLAEYLEHRFEEPHLPRAGGEVSRAALWERVIDYMSGGRGPLYCRPEDENGAPIPWSELVEKGTLFYGGVGSRRYRLDYDDPDHVPFRDIYRRPRKFTFFQPTPEDLRIPEGVILNSGRTTLSDDKERIRFAVATFNSGKATPAVDMPDENPLHVSKELAAECGLSTGDHARVTNRETGASLVLPVVVNDRAKGRTVYVSFHKSRAEVEGGRYLNELTSHSGRCPYTAQSNFKATPVAIERVSK